MHSRILALFRPGSSRPLRLRLHTKRKLQNRELRTTSQPKEPAATRLGLESSIHFPPVLCPPPPSSTTATITTQLSTPKDTKLLPVVCFLCAYSIRPQQRHSRFLSRVNLEQSSYPM
ncbi:hypothetical protein MARPO_0018s0026 [Marchantia polymorpha]|uniref:Uncharacterized protein n=1 Tax=Marchantia polymorpha TaxID=3197 RepID=A0A2R6XFF6_MARPO|nr:hypothetical protein MARPO_0018s0026 [Marchantia polymorpha]|eukprot:PTQ44835.1 hypothetical protein MARPO_0018s0026 [Marchantia polymorpha]